MMDDRQAQAKRVEHAGRLRSDPPRLSPSRLRDSHSLQVFGIVSQCHPFFRGLYSPGVSLGVPRSLLLEPDGFRYLGSAGVNSGMCGPLSARVPRPGEGPRALSLSAPLHTAVSSMLHGHSPVSQALLGTFFTWGMTAAGAALVFLFSSGQVSCLALVRGFTGGPLS